MSAPPPARRNWAPAVGLLLGLAGIVGYFLVVTHPGLGARLSGVRDAALPNWMLIAAGLACSVLGIRRSRGRVLASVLAALNVAAALWFAWLLYGMSALPPAAGPPLGTAVPQVALQDQTGKTVHLTDFRGAPLLLVFYRGHW